MRIITRIFGLFLVLFIAFMIFASVSGNSRDEEKKALVEKHCAMVWEEMNLEEKEEALNDFIKENGIQGKNGRPGESLGIVSFNILERGVKYPSTLKIDGEEPYGSLYFGRSGGVIADVSEGLIDFRKNFTAKNKLNMDVRGQLYLQVKYNAGCHDMEVVHFRVE